MLDFNNSAVRIEQITKLLKKIKGNHFVLNAAKTTLHSFSENGTSAAINGLGRKAQEEADGKRYDAVAGKQVARISDKNILAELNAVSLIGSACHSCRLPAETFREVLSEACALIDSTDYNERPY